MLLRAEKNCTSCGIKKEPSTRLRKRAAFEFRLRKGESRILPGKIFLVNRANFFGVVGESVKSDRDSPI